MKVFLISTLIIISLIPSFVFAKMFDAAVVRIVDGDSIVVATGNNVIELRLYGIDCPEYDQPFAKAAKAYTKNALLGQEVTVEGGETDKYGRLVAVVYVKHSAINQELVVAGLAWVYPRFCKKRICRRWKVDERMAQSKKIGLWKGSEPTPPWEWKRLRRK